MDIEDKVWQEMTIRSLQEVIATFTPKDKKEVKYSFLLEAIAFAGSEALDKNERKVTQQLILDLIEVLKRKGSKDFTVPEETSRVLYFIELGALKKQMLKHGYLNRKNVEHMIKTMSFFIALIVISYLNSIHYYALGRYLFYLLACYIVASVALQFSMTLCFKKKII